MSRNRTNLAAKPVGCVDACIVIGFAEQDIGAEELAALDQLFALQGDGRIVLASSYVTEEEVVQEEVALAGAQRSTKASDSGVAELPLIALRPVDQDLIVRRQPRSPAALVLT